MNDAERTGRRQVVVTGGSARVGRAAAVAFARRGAAGLEGARRDVEAAGGRALVLPTDAADAGQVEAAAGCSAPPSSR